MKKKSLICLHCMTFGGAWVDIRIRAQVKFIYDKNNYTFNYTRSQLKRACNDIGNGVHNVYFRTRQTALSATFRHHSKISFSNSSDFYSAFNFFLFWIHEFFVKYVISSLGERRTHTWTVYTTSNAEGKKHGTLIWFVCAVCECVANTMSTTTTQCHSGKLTDNDCK